MNKVTENLLSRFSRPTARHHKVFVWVVVLVATVSVIPTSGWTAEQGKGTSGKGEPAGGRMIAAIPTLASGDLYALLVGVSTYKHPRIPALQVSAKDAVDFARFLNSQKELFNKVHITVLTNEQATKAEVEKHLLYGMRKAGKNDTILVFLSGHGAIDPKRPGRYFFLTYDTDPEYLGVHALDMTGLTFLRDLDCPRVVLLADACHAGGFSQYPTKLAVVPIKTFMQDFSSSSGRVIITSSMPEELSQEHPVLGNSFFTHFFLEGLKGAADMDADGVVSVREAYDYVYNRTLTETEGDQHPQFEGRIVGVFPLSVSTKLKSRPATELLLRTDPPGADVFVGGRLVGKTNTDGTIFLKYLPVGRPVPVKVRKEGWKPQELGPYQFSESKMKIRAKVVRLRPSVASLEIRTRPGRVKVTVDGKNAGTTSRTGRLIVHGIQVAVPHVLELTKRGYEDESISVTIPVDYEGRRFKGEDIRLARAREAPREAFERPRRDYDNQRRREQSRSRKQERAREPQESSSPPTNGGALDEGRYGL